MAHRALLPMLAFCVTLLTLAASPLQAAEPGVHGSEPQGFTLENGLQVVVIEDRRAPVATQMLWYKVGAADESPGQSGIAHYLEHLMFKATDNMAQGEFSAVVEANGGRDNAFTSWDYTGYFQRVAADRLELMMQMEADRMGNLRVDLSDWLPERSVILEERSQVLESRPERVFAEQVRATLFQNHPYGIPIIGWRHEMEQLDERAATDFYKAHYAPNNAILIVAGDVSAADVRDMAARHYGQIPANPDVRTAARPLEPPHFAERRLVMRDGRVAQPFLNRVYMAPVRRAGDQAEAAAYQMLAALLGGSAQTSVLERKLTHERGVALSAWAGYSGNARDHGTFSLGVTPTNETTLEDAEAALDEVLAEFIETGVDSDQFERVQMQIRAAAIYELDDAAARARSIGADLSIGLTLEDSLGWLDALLAVTPDEVIAAARALDRRRSVTGWLMGDEG
ncbi:pitrilysin family protein [Pararhodobacter sp. SW119]|uniref:M16 family metallopeptidase n=1 Tax=Pararhodobacter sp. SW119 TaxID=2780075 RepID=UPI001ADF528F|nr:pitrilysin family protein [Pararhodobacter sp. SW119]